MSKMVWLFIVVTALCFCGCARVSRPTSIASIQDNEYWKIVEGCGYENCYPLVDYLLGNGLQIRIEPSPEEKELFIIRLNFLSTTNSELVFNPTAVKVKHSNKVLIPKPFTCSYTMWDKKYLRDAMPLTGKIPISKNSCFLLYFDVLPPSIEDTFSIDIHGLYYGNQEVIIPEVVFNKGVRR